MLITHVRANELLGKRVYGKDGRLLGEVVAIAARHGTVKAVVVRNQEKLVRLPVREPSTPRLRVLH